VGRLISSMLRLIQYPFAKVTHQNEYAKKDILIEALRQKETKVLFLDEAHHLCQTRSAYRPDRVGTNATDFIRELIDEVPMAVVLAGDTNLDRLPEVDSHLAARTAVRIALNNFDAGPIWSGIVKAMTGQKFGVELGMLELPKERQRLLAATNGNLRQLKWLVSEAVMVCADAGGTEVLPLHFSLAFERVHGADSLRSNPYKG
jgi:Bacterial TniB protein